MFWRKNHRWTRNFFSSKGVYFFIFSIQLEVKFADSWIRTADLWCWKQHSASSATSLKYSYLKPKEMRIFRREKFKLYCKMQTRLFFSIRGKKNKSWRRINFEFFVKNVLLLYLSMFKQIVMKKPEWRQLVRLTLTLLTMDAASCSAYSKRKIFTSQWGKRKLNSPSNVDTAQRSYSAVSISQPGFNSLVGTMFWAFNLLLNSPKFFTKQT